MNEPKPNPYRSRVLVAPATVVAPVTVQKISPMAYAAVFTAVLAIMPPCMFIFPLLFGYMALRDIEKNPQLAGRGRALFGIVWGFIGLAFHILSLVLMLASAAGVK